MSTYHAEMKAKHPDRPYITRPTWELRNMVRALGLLPWLNTPEDTQRKQEAERELKLRKTKTH